MVYKNKYSIIWSPSFKLELQNIYEYISISLKETCVAKKTYYEIIKAVSSLENFPERYPQIETNRILRKLPVKNYIIIYEVDSDSRTSFHLTYIS